MKILILGASGMLGSTLWRFFRTCDDVNVYGTVRSITKTQLSELGEGENLFTGVDVENLDSLLKIFLETKPDMVINCIGLIKQLREINDPIKAINLNSIFPHRLAQVCKISGARLIHFSTDCVFSGSRGAYVEADHPDALDLYGKTKHLGEVIEDHVVTLRTSIIGHELVSSHSLVDWFLSQEKFVNGYTNAIFSGVPTIELAKIVYEHILPRPELHGLYHVSSYPISKFDLLTLIAEIYNKDISINEDGNLKIDRSLNSDRFKTETGYTAPPWTELIKRMHNFS